MMIIKANTSSATGIRFQKKMTAVVSVPGSSKGQVLRIGLPSLNGFYFIEIQDIIRFRSESNYTVLYSHQKQYLITRTLKSIEETLRSYNFFRIHKSHLVNLDQVVEYSRAGRGNLVMADQANLPISRFVKAHLEERLLLI